MVILADLKPVVAGMPDVYASPAALQTKNSPNDKKVKERFHS
jgi:hypothetical protein